MPFAAPINRKSSSQSSHSSEISREQTLTNDVSKEQLATLHHLIQLQKRMKKNTLQQPENNLEQDDDDEATEEMLSDKQCRQLLASTSSGIEDNNDKYKTPESGKIPLLSGDLGGVKKKKPIVSTQKAREVNSKSNDGSYISENDNIDMMQDSQQLTPHRPEYDRYSDRNRYNINRNENFENPAKRSNSETKEMTSAVQTSKYQKVDGDDGLIVGGYYMKGNEEKMEKFQPIYFNVGNRYIKKDFVGIRRNTKFIQLGAKGKAKHDELDYPVVAFESKKNKEKSLFIEYPLRYINPIIMALQECRKRAINAGIVSEEPVFNCKYRDDTYLLAKDDKNSTLEPME